VSNVRRDGAADDVGRRQRPADRPHGDHAPSRAQPAAAVADRRPTRPPLDAVHVRRAGRRPRGRLGGAALDVFVEEPLPPDSEMWDLPNTIVTPHSSGMTNQLPGRATDRFLENLRRYVAGSALVNEVRSSR
jgi:hypothetical protein